MFQEPDGRVKSGYEDSANQLLEEIVPLVSKVGDLLGFPNFGRAFRLDSENWKAKGLFTRPAYDHTLEAYFPPNVDDYTFFCGPMITANGPPPRGWFFECFLSFREEPYECERVSIDYPHPKNKCQSTRLLLASRGILVG